MSKFINFGDPGKGSQTQFENTNYILQTGKYLVGADGYKYKIIGNAPSLEGTSQQNQFNATYEVEKQSSFFSDFGIPTQHGRTVEDREGRNESRTYHNVQGLRSLKQRKRKIKRKRTKNKNKTR